MIGTYILFSLDEIIDCSVMAVVDVMPGDVVEPAIELKGQDEERISLLPGRRIVVAL
jgi:hypothetical protein